MCCPRYARAGEIKKAVRLCVSLHTISAANFAGLEIIQLLNIVHLSSVDYKCKKVTDCFHSPEKRLLHSDTQGARISFGFLPRLPVTPYK